MFEFGLEFSTHLTLGMVNAATAVNIGYACLGATIGTLIGVLPGLGPSAALALLLPATYGMPAGPALILLASVYYGAQYGGSTTSILLGIPGEASSVVTTIDGHRMTQDGRARHALLAAGLSSFLAGTIGTLLIFAAAPALASVAFQFGPEEYLAVAVLSLTAALLVSGGPVLPTAMTGALGLWLGLIGTDVATGLQRFTYGIPELLDGIPFIALSIGLFGYSEVIAHIFKSSDSVPAVESSPIKRIACSSEFHRMWPAAFRGTGIGFLSGLLPGGGTVLASFVSYTVEQRQALAPGELRVGSGNIRGVAGPEAANNGAAQSAFIPMLVLGIPPNASTALMLGAMTLHNIQPGPQVMSANPTLFWGLVASMLIGNVILVILNVPLIRLWTSLLLIPRRPLLAVIAVACTLGIYASSPSPVFDLGLGLAFGVLGYILTHRLKIEPTTLLLAFILSPMLEENFTRAMTIQHGDLSTFISRPISASVLAVAMLMVFGKIASSWLFRNFGVSRQTNAI